MRNPKLAHILVTILVISENWKHKSSKNHFWSNFSAKTHFHQSRYDDGDANVNTCKTSCTWTTLNLHVGPHIWPIIPITPGPQLIEIFGKLQKLGDQVLQGQPTNFHHNRPTILTEIFISR